MAVFDLDCSKDIHTVDTYHYTLYIHQISFEYLWGNMVKLTNITLPDKKNLLIKALKALEITGRDFT